MPALKKILKFYTSRITSRIKRLLANFIRYLPISSQYIGPPKGYYTSSKKYWETNNKNNLNNRIMYSRDLPSSVIQRKPPKSVSSPQHWRFDGKNLHECPETFVISIPNGRIFIDNDMSTSVITHDDRLLFDVSLKFGIGIEKVKSHRIFSLLKFPELQRINETAALLTTAGSSNYFHWLIDALPRLEILKRTLLNRAEITQKYIVNKGVPAIAESLKMLGIPSDKLIFLDCHDHIQVDHLIVPSLPGGRTGNPPGWVCNFLRESFLIHRATIAPVNKLYISRSKAHYRRVENEEDGNRPSITVQ